MIGYIKGRLLSREEGVIVIENGGIGFEVHVPDPGQFVSLQDGPTEAEVWTTSRSTLGGGRWRGARLSPPLSCCDGHLVL